MKRKLFNVFKIVYFFVLLIVLILAILEGPGVDNFTFKGIGFSMCLIYMGITGARNLIKQMKNK